MPTAVSAGLVSAGINAALLGYFMVAVPTELLGRAGSAQDLLSLGATPLSPCVTGFGYLLLGWTGILPASDQWAGHAAAIDTAAGHQR
ncbi:hypothetical protein [Arthrobacter sp. STN4]|uniref:hypothetical protein n=1 Tax=Arthrobacter sp. STN4 TaxID=2923276 RepID=UPI00211A0C80|nr:hypothetical protein [Arthrobacter sp. STN4]MCQ9163216.1 hypothetical protein [Arthrobacter sp. STN4]